MKARLVFLGVLLLFPAAVLAGGANLPVEVMTAQGISYYNGGVGLDERADLPQLYTLKIVLATDRGLYLNNAEVKIHNQENEEVFRVTADNGPWLIADLPPGTYTVEAVLEGQKATARGIRIDAGSKQSTTLRWKTSSIDMGL